MLFNVIKTNLDFQITININKKKKHLEIFMWYFN